MIRILCSWILQRLFYKDQKLLLQLFFFFGSIFIKWYVSCSQWHTVCWTEVCLERYWRRISPVVPTTTLTSSPLSDVLREDDRLCSEWLAVKHVGVVAVTDYTAIILPVGVLNWKRCEAQDYVEKHYFLQPTNYFYLY